MLKSNVVLVLSDEYSLLSDKLKKMHAEKEEIAYLGREANLQGSETFGHDNPILESKHEKSMLLSMQRPKFVEIEKHLSTCLIATESEILKRKNRELLENGRISIDIGSIVRLKIDRSTRDNEILITGLTQGTKINFMGKQYSTICASSPIRAGIAGKYKGDEGFFLHNGQKKSISIIDVS